MSLPRITQSPSSGYAYIYLADDANVAESVPLEAEDSDDPDALDSIVLDFGKDGRLVG